MNTGLERAKPPPSINAPHAGRVQAATLKHARRLSRPDASAATAAIISAVVQRHVGRARRRSRRCGRVPPLERPSANLVQAAWIAELR